MFKFILKGKPENSDSPVILIGQYVDKAFSGAIMWMHVHSQGVTQCAETLTKEEIGQFCVGN